MDIEDKAIIVTGASAGIGRALAEALARAGADVVLVARREERLELLAEQMAIFPGRRLVVAGDIRDENFAPKVIERTLGEFGRLDVLINNAGLGHRSLIADMTPEDMRTIVDTNILGLLFMTQAALRPMQEQKAGQIINISSIAGQRPLPNGALYPASKAAVNFIGRSLRIECKPYNIKVTTVYPGLTKTEFGYVRLGEKGINRFGLEGVPAERVAAKIVQAIRHERSDVYVTWYDWLFVTLNRLFPGTTDWVVSRGAHLA